MHCRPGTTKPLLLLALLVWQLLKLRFCQSYLQPLGQ